MREEFETVQAPPFEARGKVTDEYLRLMREMWTKEPVQFTGTYYRLPSVSALPKPRQKGGIPIWIGGHTDVALRRTGELADAWHPIGMGIETIFARPQSLDRVWVRAGFIPLPEAELPRALRGRPGVGLFGWRGGTALWSGRGGARSALARGEH